MSNSDKEVLEEFETWRANVVGNGKDLSVAAFLKERENDHNRLRIADALNLLNVNIPIHERPDKITPDTYENVLGSLRSVRDILEGDRPWVEDKYIIGETRRVYV